MERDIGSLGLPAGHETGAAMSKCFWFPTVMNAWILAIEASAVICFRSAKLCAGDAEAGEEAMRMVREKVQAAFALQLLAMSGRLGNSALRVTNETLGHYRGIVGANLRRLGP